MPSIDDIFTGGGGGDWLRAADITEEVALTINGVEIKQMRDGKKKPVLSFTNYPKKLPVNWTNASRIAEAYGKNTDRWIGLPVTLYPDRVKGPQGGLVDSIGVRVPRTQRNSRQAPLENSEISPPDPETAPPADEGY